MKVEIVYNTGAVFAVSGKTSLNVKDVKQLANDFAPDDANSYIIKINNCRTRKIEL